MAGFVLRFVVYLAVGVALVNLGAVERHAIEPWTRLNATGGAALARGLGIDAVAAGTSIRLGDAELRVLGGCNGVHALLILLASILAYPASWARRLGGLAAGTPILLGCNVVRIVSLVAVARHWPERLELFHVYVWQTLIVLIALALFLAWGTYGGQIYFSHDE